MKLLVKKVEREGIEYEDLYLCWVNEGKSYAMRVRPVFWRDLKTFMAKAERVPDGEQVEKYI